jgi:hypothetical protein
MSSSSPTPSSTSTLHPLHSVAVSTTSSTFDLAQSSSSSRAPSPVQRGVRSRRPTPSQSPFLNPPPPHLEPTNADLDDSADVTRPNLRKATKDALGLAGQGSNGRTSDVGKGKQRERTRAASDGLPHSDQDREREVVVHKVRSHALTSKRLGNVRD